MDQNHIFLDETGCILNEKMMPDVTITVPELGHRYFYEETSGPCAHKPSNSLECSKKLSGASPYLGISSETSHLYTHRASKGLSLAMHVHTIMEV
jgi:hypothetical protein